MASKASEARARDRRRKELNERLDTMQASIEAMQAEINALLEEKQAKKGKSKKAS